MCDTDFGMYACRYNNHKVQKQTTTTVFLIDHTNTEAIIRKVSYNEQ